MEDVTDGEIYAISKMDGNEYLSALDRGIDLARDILEQRKAGDGYVGGNGDLGEWANILTDLLDIRNDIFSGKAMTQIERSNRIYFHRFVDGWDPADNYGNLMAVLMVYYLKHERIQVDPALKANPLVERAVKYLAPINAELLRAYENRPLPPAHPDTLDLPHRPDRNSLELMHDAAAQAVRRGGPEYGGAVAAEYALAQQYLLLALTERFFKRPVTTVVENLRRGHAIARHAFAAGYPAHAWDVHHLFLGAVAVHDRRLADALIAMRQDRWDGDRVRPVPWLILRILACFALHRGDDARAAELIERHRLAVFVDRLPPELEPDLPEMRNVHQLLDALVRRDAQTFSARIAERMEIRARALRRSPLDTSGLCDLAGLALCRFARSRGLAVTVRHVYLPLELLDIPPAPGPAAADAEHPDGAPEAR